MMEAQVSTNTAQLKTADLQQQLCEAALYVSGRPLDLKMIGSVIGARSEDKIRGVATAVSERYRSAGSPIQVVELPDGRFVMQLKAEFAKHGRKLAYAHVKQLKDMDLINDERIGRTRMLRTTTTFADYFNLNHDPSLMKKELKKVLQVGEYAPSSAETAKPDS